MIAKAFCNIPSDWDNLTIGDLITFSGGSQPPQKVFIFEEKAEYIRLIQTRDYRTDKYKTFIPKKFAKKICNNEDIMIGRYGPPVFQIFKGLEGAYNVALIKATPNAKVDPDYCYNFLMRPELRLYIECLSQRSGGQTGVDIDKLKDYPFPLPSILEQKAIAKILSTWDKAVEITQKLIVQKELSKKWLMQQLLTGKKRLKGFENAQRTKTSTTPPIGWKIMFVSDIMSRIKESFEPNPEKFYQEIGIRSHAKGIFYKPLVKGKSLGDKSVFWIKPNCFIVNIVFAWEQAIAKTTENENGMIASHRFPMYKPKENILDLDYILLYFSSERGKYLLGLASPGGAGRNKTLGQSEFMNLLISLPSIEEQIAIAKVLQNADIEVQLLKNKLEMIKEQKKGLMQQLLTGKLRVNTK